MEKNSQKLKKPKKKPKNISMNNARNLRANSHMINIHDHIWVYVL